jgi:hypothetical protein
MFKELEVLSWESEAFPVAWKPYTEVSEVTNSFKKKLVVNGSGLNPQRDLEIRLKARIWIKIPGSIWVHKTEI